MHTTGELTSANAAHREVVEDEHVEADQFANPLLPGAIGVAAGQVGQHPAGLPGRAHSRQTTVSAAINLPTSGLQTLTTDQDNPG